MGTSIKSSSPPPAPTQEEVAAGNYEAQLKYMAPSAKLGYEIQANPEYGALPTTQLYEDIRRKVYGGESGVRDQMLANILANLQSPTGLTPEQQSALDARRGQAQSEVQKAMRERANLGGNLYGGKATWAEGRAVSDLQNQFATEDITRQEQARLNALQAALPALQILYPEAQITAPQFQSPVASGNTALQTSASNYGTQVGYLNQVNQSNAAMRAAMWQALGEMGGSATKAAAAKMCWVAAEVFGGWDKQKTLLARHFILSLAPTWFYNFYSNNGEQIASFIHDKPILKMLLRPLFEIFAFIGKKNIMQKIIAGMV